MRNLSKLSSKGNFKVKVVSLDDLVSQDKIPPPDYMKIDVEGAEMLALSGARQILSTYHQTTFLATHGIDVHRQCCEFLKSTGYNLKSINRQDVDNTDELIAFKKHRD